MPSPWLLLVGIPVLAGTVWILALIPVWGWFFVIIPLLGLIYLPYYYVRRFRIYLANRGRETTIKRAIEQMPPDEKYMWFNREGPYLHPHCIPRSTPLQVMTERERYRYANRVGEFSDGQYQPVGNYYYDD